jgi:putative lipoic acid-binding regulatory protein
MTNEGTTTLLQFPCQFPIKAMGRNSDDFEELVTAIVLKHAELWLDEPVRVSPSKEGNFIAVTAVINATSQQQLDSIYQELTDCSLVLMAL